MIDSMHTMLSEAGRTRQAAMLNELKSAMAALHRRRRIRRRVAAALAVIVLGAAAVTVPGTRSTSRPESGVTTGPDSGLRPPVADSGQQRRAAAAAQRVVDFAVVQTDPTILERYAAHPPPVAEIEYIGDDRLIQTLAAIGRPAGLIRIADEFRFTAPVTDDELRAAREPAVW
jgi:hypothetical protein